MYIACSKINLAFSLEKSITFVCASSSDLGTRFSWCISCKCLITEPVCVCIRKTLVEWTCRTPDIAQGFKYLFSVSVLVHGMVTKIWIPLPSFNRFVHIEPTLQFPSFVINAQSYFGVVRYWLLMAPRQLMQLGLMVDALKFLRFLSHMNNDDVSFITVR